jgi:hypothetical protein
MSHPHDSSWLWRLGRAYRPRMRAAVGALWIALTVGLIGCGGRAVSASYVIYIDPAFSSAQQTLIEGAVATWSTALTSSQVHLSIAHASCDKDDADGIICTHPATEAFVKTMASPQGTTLGYADWGSSTSSNVYLVTEKLAPLGDLGWTKVTEHELGHAFGLVHVPARQIMCATVECASQTVTCGDVSQYDALRDEPPCKGDLCIPEEPQKVTPEEDTSPAID